MSDENRVADEAVNADLQDNSTLEEKTSRRSRKKPELDRSEVKLTVGQLIAIKRRELHWSQEELAWQSGVSRTQIGRIERDESDPVVDTIEALESALGIELYERFMSQKRERAKGKKRRKKKRPPGKVLERFAKELKDTGISEEEMMNVLASYYKDDITDKDMLPEGWTILPEDELDGPMIAMNQTKLLPADEAEPSSADTLREGDSHA